MSNASDFIIENGVLKQYVGWSVLSIGSYVFSGCSSLKEVTIPEGVTSIEERTFSGCSSLTDMIIPDSITEIRDETLRGCSNLINVTIPDSVISIGKWTFRDCLQLTLHVPAKSYADKYAKENNIPFVAE